MYEELEKDFDFGFKGITRNKDKNSIQFWLTNTKFFETIALTSDRQRNIW